MWLSVLLQMTKSKLKKSKNISCNWNKINPFNIVYLQKIKKQ